MNLFVPISSINIVGSDEEIEPGPSKEVNWLVNDDKDDDDDVDDGRGEDDEGDGGGKDDREGEDESGPVESDVQHPQILIK